jgi:hypothetical protein
MATLNLPLASRNFNQLKKPIHLEIEQNLK